ncbi:serine hydrolase domain-containing protein [Streptomyces sp. NPDC047928]|uniref:serine hydrolase domain-containing protein n=1 Tax=unclassified Streptomyces TaxID=2593676 RepID=UPI0037148040
MRTARPVRTVAAALAVVAAVVATALAAPASAGERPDHARDKGRHQATQDAIEDLVRQTGVPGMLAQAQDRHGTWNGGAGVADRETGRQRAPHDRYRIGSITKTFIATVVLQLEAERRLDLDDTVERWLPGVVTGNGHDGRRVTLRQLLNHTSGVFDVTSDPGFAARVFGPDFLRHRYDTWTPRQLVSIAMKHPPAFAPGTDWGYSNTNYVLAGMVIEKATGRPYGTEVERRVLKPLGLRATSVPGTDARMPRPSGRAYSTLGGNPYDPSTPIHDVTELNPSIAGAAGEMVADAADLQRFLRALLKGKLLPPAQLREMTDTVAIDGEAAPLRYGLGLMRWKLSCGTEVWGHNGGIHGSGSVVAATRNARHSLATNINGDWGGGADTVLEAEFCR